MAEKILDWQKILLRNHPGLFDVAGFNVGDGALMDLLMSQGKTADEASEIAKLAVRKAQAEVFMAKHPLIGGWRKRK